MRHALLVAVLTFEVLVPLPARPLEQVAGRAVARHVGLLAASHSFHLAAAQAPQSFGTETTAITVDVVVQDKDHRPITDLARTDFELVEDGVRQEIGDVQIVAVPADGGARTGGRERDTGNGRNDGPARAVISPTFVALVFDEMTTEGRYYASKAAEAYLETQHVNDFAGVFQTGSSLVTLTPYTNDPKALTAALKKVAGKASTPLQDPAKATGPGEAIAPVGGAASSGSSGGRIPAAVSGAALAEKAVTIWQMERLGRGYATANALRAIVGALGSLPGRKTVVFFADNVAMPEEAMPTFAEVGAAANRANVAIYTVDVAGLRAVSQNVISAGAVDSVGRKALELDSEGGSLNNLRSIEDMERTLRENPHVSLSLLSRDTGGFLVDNTNNLADAFRRIDAERRFHYLLTYTPSNPAFKGEWRSIVVTVPSRTGLVVRARSGYLAVRTPGAIPLLTYEGRAAAALERQPPPNDLPIRAAALVFPSPSGDPHVAILADTPAAAVTFEEVADRYRSDFTLLARLRNAQGEVVRKASRPYRLSGPIADRARVQAGAVLFYRQPTVPPGEYTLDVVVADALSQKAGVKRIALTVPDDKQGPRVSSLVLVARAEKVPPAPTPGADDNELSVGDLQLYPNLGQPYRRADNLPFYAAVIPTSASVVATLGVVRDGATLATLPLQVPAPDASGRIRILGQLPLVSLAAGVYSLTLTITGGPTPVVRSASFTVVG